MPDKVKLVIENTKSEFYVWEEGNWVLGGTEYVYLYDGTKKMRASSRSVVSSSDSEVTTITRFASWKDNISTEDIYTFNSSNDEVKLFPISHTFKCVNCEDKIVHFEYRDIQYDGISRLATSPESFGHQMVVEWQKGNYYAKLFQQKVASDKLIIRYRPISNIEYYTIRLFDPPIDLSIEGLSQNVDVELGSPLTIIANQTGDTVCLDVNHYSLGINISCTENLTSTTINITSFRKTVFNDSSSSLSLPFNSGSNTTVYISSHQYDEIINLTINISGLLTNNTFPTNVEIFVNNTLSNSIGNVFNTTKFSVTSFNDSTLIKNVTFDQSETNVIGYVRIPKTATVTNAVLSLRSDDNIQVELGFPAEPFIIVEATNASVANFSGSDNVSASSFVDPFDNETKWIVNASDSDFDNRRAKIYKAVFYGTSGSNPFVVDTFTNPTVFATTVDRDVTSRGYYAELTVLRTPGAGNAPRYMMNATFNDNTSDFNCSPWADVTVTGELFIPVTGGQSVSSKPGEGNATSFEADNPNAVRLIAQDNQIDATASKAKALLICTGSMAWINPLRISGTSPATITSTVTDFYLDEGIPLFTNFTNYFINDPWIKLGSLNGSKDFEFIGVYNQTNTTKNLSTEVNDFLSTCTADSDGFCDMPINVYSATPGFIEISNMSFNYTDENNPVTINLNLSQTFLNNSFNYTNLPITFKSSSNGTLVIDDLKFDFRGGNDTFKVLAHTPDYSSNQSYNITYYFSDWGFAFPKYVEYLEFIPRSRDDKNVTPYKQNSFTPIFNITSQSYGAKNFNYSIYINESFSCVNMTANNYFNKTDGDFLQNSTWVNITEDAAYMSETDIWLWADYDCNFTEWRIWQPLISLRACCTDCDVCSNNP